MMKGVSPLIATIFVVAISISAMTIVLRLGLPVIEKSQEFSNVREAETILNSIDSAVREITAEGEGSSRRVSIRSSGGTYEINSSSDKVTFELLSEHGAVAHNATFIEGRIFFNTTKPKSGDSYAIILQLNYTNIDFINTTRWEKGSYTLYLENSDVSGNNATIETKLL